MALSGCLSSSGSLNAGGTTIHYDIPRDVNAAGACDPAGNKFAIIGNIRSFESQDHDRDRNGWGWGDQDNGKGNGKQDRDDDDQDRSSSALLNTTLFLDKLNVRVKCRTFRGQSWCRLPR